MKKHFLLVYILIFIIAENCTASWTQINGPSGATILDFAIDSNDIIYLACGNGIYYSDDNGYHWNSTSFINGASSIGLLNNSTIFVGTWEGIYRSTDFGNNWTHVLSLNNTINIKDFAFNDNVIIAAATHYMSQGGVYKSVDNGETWEFISFSSTRSVTLHQNGAFYAGTFGNIYKSVNNGETWTNIFNCERVEAISVNSEGIIYCGTANDFGYGGIYYSSDDGNTWSTASLNEKRITDIDFDSEDNIYACSESGEVFRSLNNSDQWDVIFDSYSKNYALAFNNDFDLFLGTSSGFGVYRKLSGSDNWDNINYGLPNLPIIAIDQFNSGEIIIGTTGGTYLTLDEGINFTQINQGLRRPDIQCMIITPENDVFVGTTATGGGCIYKRNIDDYSWIQSHPPKQSFNTLLIDQMGIIYSGLNNYGVVRSLDNGITWEDADEGMEHNYVYTLEEDSTGRIYAGTYGGIYNSDNQGENWSFYGLEGKSIDIIKNVE